MSHGLTVGNVDELVEQDVVATEAEGDSLLEDARARRETEPEVQLLHDVFLVLADLLTQQVFVAHVALLRGVRRLGDDTEQFAILLVILVGLHQHVEHFLQLQYHLAVLVLERVGVLLVDALAALDGEAEGGAAEGAHVIQEACFDVAFSP